tara:strand:- start:7118 stop:8533 length:1416 start_codon:yes stop_codon:yes gene_type:complete
MANWELQLITSIVRGDQPPKNFETCLRQGIQFKTFSSIEAKTLWSAIESHYTRPHNFGYIPSEDSLSEQFPNLDLPKPLENLVDLCEKVNTGHLKRQADRHINKYLEILDEDPFKAVADLQSDLAGLQEETSSNSDVSFSRVALQECISDIQNTMTASGVTGMPWPWARLNAATGGIQDGDFIMVWALPKSMKTWFGLVIAAELLRTGRRVLVYSKEMTWDAVRRRITSIIAKVDYTRLKKGDLSQAERAHYFDCIEQLASEDFPGELFFTNADRADGSPGGPTEIRRKIESYRPHFVLLDSAYMLELPNSGHNALDWKQLSLVNRQLKQIAKTTKIPILAILQENERSAMKYAKSRGTASLAMNTGAVMDCDVGLRLVYHSKRKEISIHCAAARETTDAGFTIHAIPGSNFSYAHNTLHNVGDDFREEEEENAVQEVADPAPQVIQSPFMTQSRSGRERPEDEFSGDISE